MISKPLSLDNLAGGVCTEKFNIELQRVLENIDDPNTTLAQRKITLDVKFKIDKDRDLAQLEVSCKSVLAPDESFPTRIYIGKGLDGKPEAYEDNPKQPKLPPFDESNMETETPNNVTPMKGVN